MMMEFKYEEGQIINGLKILERKKATSSSRKTYICKCVKDGHISEKLEGNLDKGQGCGVCANQIIVKGINDIATTHSWMVKYFVNKEDAEKYSFSSGAKVEMQCLDCGNIVKRKISNLYKEGIKCTKCREGLSYSEKFVSKVLEQLGVKYISQYSQEWSQGRRYDFYLPNENIIIEVHGIQHYIKSFKQENSRSLEQEKINDTLKEVLAIGNLNCKYIIIDCRESSLEWIRNSILNTPLFGFLKTEVKINWEECEHYALGNLAKSVSEEWKNGLRDIQKISDKFNIHSATTLRYLRKGEKIGWNTYSKDIKEINAKKLSKRRSRKVYCVELDRVFNSATEIEKMSEELFGKKINRANISKLCNGNGGLKTCGGYHFHFI